MQLTAQQREELKGLTPSQKSDLINYWMCQARTAREQKDRIAAARYNAC